MAAIKWCETITSAVSSAPQCGIMIRSTFVFNFQNFSLFDLIIINVLIYILWNAEFLHSPTRGLSIKTMNIKDMVWWCHKAVWDHGIGLFNCCTDKNADKNLCEWMCSSLTHIIFCHVRRLPSLTAVKLKVNNQRLNEMLAWIKWQISLSLNIAWNILDNVKTQLHKNTDKDNFNPEMLHMRLLRCIHTESWTQGPNKNMINRKESLMLEKGVLNTNNFSPSSSPPPFFLLLVVI